MCAFVGDENGINSFWRRDEGGVYEARSLCDRANEQLSAHHRRR